MSSHYPRHHQFFHIGRTLKSHGTGGQLRLMIEDQYKSYLKKGSFIFFDLNGSKVPYMLMDIDDGAHFVITIEDVYNKMESDLLSGLDIWIPLENVKSRHQRSPRNIKDKWSDYRIKDEKTQAYFDIIRTEEFPQQLMAVVEVENKEILIPLNEQLISDIDKENKIIVMEIPEGLLDL